MTWWTATPDLNVAAHCKPSGFFVLDIDPRSGGYESFARFEELVAGEIPDTVAAKTGQYGPQRGRHLFFRIPDGEVLLGKLSGLPGIDIKHNGYVLLAPSRHVSGVSYEWEPGHAPWEMDMAEPSPEMLALLRKHKPRSASGTSGTGGTWDFVDDLEWGGDKLDLEKFYEEGIVEGARAVEIYRMACALANQMPNLNRLNREMIESTMQKFNFEMVKPPLEFDELMRHVHRAIEFVAANPKSDLNKKYAGMGETLLKNVTGGKPEPVADRMRDAATPMVSERQATAEFDPDLMDWESGGLLSSVAISKDSDALFESDGADRDSRTLTDTGNGRRFVDAFGNSIRYTPGLGWFRWTGEYWKPDVEELEVREMAKRVAAIIGAEAASQEDGDLQKKYYDWSKQAKSNARQSATLESAQSDPRIGVPVEFWDGNPYLLGVANGVIDLRTGDLLKGRPDLHLTRRSPVAYSPGFSSPRFQEFLDFATGGDREFQDWLQRAFGYTLTGLRRYDILFLVYGPAGSGKNVIVESLVKMLGTKQYAFPMDSSVLAQGDGKGNASDQYYWAELRGKRMAWVDELPESERLKENSVKKLTGSAEISARSPGEKPFTFDSQVKLWITTNHRPAINDDAMWRRLRPIPWVNVPGTPDPTLKEFLHDPEGGLPAILSWAVEGAIKLNASKEIDALGWCKAVYDAAEIYRKNEDRMGLFLEEETILDPSGSVPIKNLYSVYKSWTEMRGERPLSQIRFSNKISERGLDIRGMGASAVLYGFQMNGASGTVTSGYSLSPSYGSMTGSQNWGSLLEMSDQM